MLFGVKPKMDEKESFKKIKVAEIFQTMSYGENFEDLSKVSVSTISTY